MTDINQISPRAFAVWFKDLERWDPSSFHRIVWHWPKEVMVAIGSVLQIRKEKVDRSQYIFSELQPITIHFDGSIERRNVDENREYTMDLFFAYPGDIVVAKIDLKNGAVAIVPKDWNRVVVTGHFAVYKPDRSKLLPEYLHRLIQTRFFKAHLWRNKVGAEGRKEVKLVFFESLQIPLPALSIQQAIVALWQKAQVEVELAKTSLQKVTLHLNSILYAHYYANCKEDILKSCSFVVMWKDISAWDVKTARAAAFRISNPSFKPLGEFVEEATILIKPWEEPEKEWPVYGVNNREGVFFSYYQRGEDFNSAYKRIQKNWFFHNPTRSSVGSLGIVPDVPHDAITSPEYQVWRIKQGLLPDYVAVLISTPFFINLIRLNRVGAVKQRLYVENLLQIPVPVLSDEEQQRIAKAREEALKQIAEAKKRAIVAEAEVEELILGTKKLEILELEATQCPSSNA